jgi:hypothetical protein
MATARKTKAVKEEEVTGIANDFVFMDKSINLLDIVVLITRKQAVDIQIKSLNFSSRLNGESRRKKQQIVVLLCVVLLC